MIANWVANVAAVKDQTFSASARPLTVISPRRHGITNNAVPTYGTSHSMFDEPA